MLMASPTATSSRPQPTLDAASLGLGGSPSLGACVALVHMVLRHCLKTNTLVPATVAAQSRPRTPSSTTFSVGRKRPLAQPRLQVHERRQLRRAGVAGAPGFLRELRVTKSTKDKYSNVLSALALHNHTTVDLLMLEMPEVVDAYAESYVEHRFLCNGDRSDAGYVIAAVAYFFVWSLRDPQVLPLTKAAVQGWKRHEPDSARLPCPWIVALMISRWLALQQDAAMLQSARAVVLQFDLMARPSEIVGVMTKAVCLPRHRHSGAYSTAAVVFAPSDEVLPLEGMQPAVLTKASEQDDTVAIDCNSFVGVEFVLRASVKHAQCQAHPRLFYALTYPLYAKHVALASRALLLPFNVSPHMFRHGGASEAVHRQRRSLKEVQVRGRWKAFSSVRRYQKSGRLLHVTQRLTAQMMQDGFAAERSLPSFLL